MEVNKYVVGCSIVALAGSFACGRYSVSAPAVHTVIDTKIDTRTKEADNTHTQTKIVEVKAKDGTETKTTIIDQVKNDEISKVQDQTQHVDQTVTPPKKGTINVSALVGTRFLSPDGIPLYGASFTKEFIGPVTLGAWGLNNGTIGVSIGFNF